MTNALVRGPGFLGTRAPLYADLALILILLTAVLFTIGWRLAVGRHLDAHRWIQTLAVIINTGVAVVVMIASFIIYILPGIPGKLLEGTYGITTVHAFVGTLALLLGVFVVMRGHEQVPKRLRFSNYKLFMRISYALYMLATLLGVIVYVAVYAAGPA
jgi:uncharacterized membrane protein YozB (DUF420 family)